MPGKSYGSGEGLGERLGYGETDSSGVTVGSVSPLGSGVGSGIAVSDTSAVGVGVGVGSEVGSSVATSARIALLDDACCHVALLPAASDTGIDVISNANIVRTDIIRFQALLDLCQLIMLPPNYIILLYSCMKTRLLRLRNRNRVVFT